MTYIQVPFLLYSGVSPISAAIRWQTRSKYSHVAIVIPAGLYPGIEEDTVVEAKEFKGVIRRPLEQSDYKAAGYLLPIPDVNYLTATSWLLSQVGKEYDYTMVARFLTRRQESRKSTGKWFCSELAFAYASRLGIQLLSDTEPWEVSPGLLAKSPLIFKHRELSQ